MGLSAGRWRWPWRLQIEEEGDEVVGGEHHPISSSSSSGSSSGVPIPMRRVASIPLTWAFACELSDIQGLWAGQVEREEEVMLLCMPPKHPLPLPLPPLLPVEQQTLKHLVVYQVQLCTEIQVARGLCCWGRLCGCHTVCWSGGAQRLWGVVFTG